MAVVEALKIVRNQILRERMVMVMNVSKSHLGNAYEVDFEMRIRVVVVCPDSRK